MVASRIAQLPHLGSLGQLYQKRRTCRAKALSWGSKLVFWGTDARRATGESGRALARVLGVLRRCCNNQRTAATPLHVSDRCLAIHSPIGFPSVVHQIRQCPHTQGSSTIHHRKRNDAEPTPAAPPSAGDAAILRGVSGPLPWSAPQPLAGAGA
eukprot:gene16116-biopygen15792